MKLVGSIMFASISLLSAERQRYFQNRYYQLLKEEEEALNATYPDYSNHEIGTIEKEIEIFTNAYSTELAEAIKNVKASSN